MIKNSIQSWDGHSRKEIEEYIKRRLESAASEVAERFNELLKDAPQSLDTLKEIADKIDTLYTKPETGIPATDLAEGVIPTISTDITTDGDSDTKTASPKAVKTYVDESIPAALSAIESEIETVGRGEYVTAWDGASTPVVADIPAGVSVTYNTTSYTGELAASDSTMGKIYLVSTGTTDEYDRYVTVRSGSVDSYTYSWSSIGSTSIQLSDFATKAEVSQLGQKVTDLENVPTQLSETILGPAYFTQSSPTIVSYSAGFKVYYYPVKQGDKLKVTASEAQDRAFNYGFTTVVPAVNVSVTNATSVSTSSIDLVLNAPADGYFVVAKYQSYFTDLVVERLDDTIDTIKELKDDVEDYGPRLTNAETDISQLGQKVLINSFIGQGSTYTTTKLILIKGEKYRLVLENPNYARDNTGTDPLQTVFTIYSYTGSTETRLFTVFRSSNVVNKEYVFTVPNDSDYITVGGRANDGVEVLFEVSGIDSDIAKIKDEVTALQETTLRNKFIGQGSAFVTTRLNLIKGQTYKVVLDNPNYAHDNTGTEPTQYIFAIYSYAGEVLTQLVYILRSVGIVSKEYEITVPNDSDYVTIGGRANSGVEVLFEVYPSENSDIVSKNTDKIDVLRASSNNGKRLQLLCVTDAHEDWTALQNAITFANSCSYIDGILLTGDNCGYAVPSLSTFQHYYDIVSASVKPVFSIPGNHDAGYDKRLRYTASSDMIHQYITAPTIPFLESGENPSGKNYFYHDFTSKKIRLICLDEYDEEIQIVSNENWEPIAYNSSLDDFALGTSYEIGDECNFGLYTANSFRCVTAHTSSAENELRTTEYRGYRFISEAQMTWLISTMLTTPADYGLVISTHIPASDGYKTDYRDNKFSSKFINAISSFNAMYSDILGILADAFNNGSSGTLTVKGTGTFTYLNTEGSGGNTYAYEIPYDFSLKAEGAKFLVFVCGHTHYDAIFKNAFNLYSISPTFTTATTRQFDTNDCPRSSNINDIARDALTAVAFDLVNDGVIMTRIGTTSTTDGYKRDVDRLSI